MILSPSLLSADFSRLADELAALEAAGISWLHLDIMDGAFVPNITFGQPVIKSLRKRSSKLFFDVHLMIEEPARYLESFRDAGADMLVIHAEADRHPQRTLSEIRRLGMKAGLAFNPGTDIASLRWLAPDLDMVLVMSVNPGFSGQKFIPQSFDKIRATRAMLNAAGAGDVLIQVAAPAPRTPHSWWPPVPTYWSRARPSSAIRPMTSAIRNSRPPPRLRPIMPTMPVALRPPCGSPAAP